MSVKSCVKARGFFRLKIGETVNGKLRIVSDSKWQQNQIVDNGFQKFIVSSLGGIANSLQVGYVGIGTGTAPNATHNTLNGETGTRKATTNTLVGTGTMQATASWASGDHPGGTPSIANLGLFNSVSSGSMCCGNTFASSAWNSNQAVSVTYQIRFT